MTWRRGILSFYHKLRSGVRVLLPAMVLSGLCAALPVSAEDIFFSPVAEEDIIHEEREITYKDLIDEESGNGGTGLNTYISLSESVSYYPERDWYVYTFGSNANTTVTANIPNGLFTNEAVSIELGSDIQCVFCKDGIESDADMQEITAPGNYVLLLTDLNGNDLGSFAFRITEKYTNTAAYRIPEDFYVYEVLRDGVAVDTGLNTVSMAEEGEYMIAIRNDRIDRTYCYTAVADHTAPTLALRELDEKNAAKSAVDISDLEEDTDIVITWNGETVERSRTLSTPGRYVLLLTDAAGNITIYQFTIYMYLTVSGTVAIVILGALYLALMIYLIISRKNMRVR